jgi:hypothetical protein
VLSPGAPRPTSCQTACRSQSSRADSASGPSRRRLIVGFRFDRLPAAYSPSTAQAIPLSWTPPPRHGGPRGVRASLVQDRGARGRSHGDEGVLRRPQRRGKLRGTARRGARGSVSPHQRPGRPSRGGDPVVHHRGARRHGRGAVRPAARCFRRQLLVTARGPRTPVGFRATSSGCRRKFGAAPPTPSARGPAAPFRPPAGARGAAIRRRHRGLDDDRDWKHLLPATSSRTGSSVIDRRRAAKPP